MSRVGSLAVRALRSSPVPPLPNDRDSPLLSCLLGEFAGRIGRIFGTPRQIKRFSSKARIQHTLLHALVTSEENLAKAESERFVFGHTQQALAFILLLLIETETAREDKEDEKEESKQPDDPRTRLRDKSEEEFVSQLATLFDTWHTSSMDAKAYTEFVQLARQQDQDSELPNYAQLPTAFLAPTGVCLQPQLYRLNAGMLV
jgi:hypothetical protein